MSGQRGDIYICEPGRRRTNFNWTSVAKRGRKERVTVAIGDRNSEGVYSWDSAEGLGQAKVLWFYQTRMVRL